MPAVPLRYFFLARLTAGLFLASSLLLAGMPAQASLIGDSVTAQLLSPNGITSDPSPINLSDTVTVGSGVEISAGDGSNIGGPTTVGTITDCCMLTGATASEFIDFQADQILVQILAGDTDQSGNLITGYASGAQYILSSLDYIGGVITGITVNTSGFINPSALAVTLVDPNTISLNLDTVEIAPPASGTAFGDVTIGLQVRLTEPPPPTVPEPSTLLLIAAPALLLLRKRSSV